MSIIQPIIGPLIEPIIRGIDAPLCGGSQSLTDQVRAALFSNGEQGGMWDATLMSSLYQDSAGTTPVMAFTQPIGRMSDISGNVNHLLQSTSSARPQYTADGALFDGVDDFMYADTLTLAGADPWTIMTGMNNFSSGPTCIVASQGNGWDIGISYLLINASKAVNSQVFVDGANFPTSAGFYDAMTAGDISFRYHADSMSFDPGYRFGEKFGYFAAGITRKVVVNKELTPAEIALVDAWIAEVAP